MHDVIYFCPVYRVSWYTLALHWSSRHHGSSKIWVRPACSTPLVQCSRGLQNSNVQLPIKNCVKQILNFELLIAAPGLTASCSLQRRPPSTPPSSMAPPHPQRVRLSDRYQCFARLVAKLWVVNIDPLLKERGMPQIHGGH